MEFNYPAKKYAQPPNFPHQQNPRGGVFQNRKVSKYNEKFQKRPHFEKPKFFNPNAFVSPSMIEDPWKYLKPPSATKEY